MYYLFWFTKDKKISILKDDDILSKGDRIVNEYYDVRFGEESWNGKLVSGASKYHNLKKKKHGLLHVEKINSL